MPGATNDTLLGLGLKFEYATLGGTSFTTLPRVMDVSGPSKSKKTVTHVDADSGTEETVIGVTQLGKVTFPIVFNSPNMTAVEALFGVEKSYKLTLSDTSYKTFDAVLTSIGDKYPIENVNMVDLEFTIKKTAAVFTAKA